MASKVPCVASGPLYSRRIVLLEDTAQGQLLGEGGGDSRREGVFSGKSKSENRREASADRPRSGERGHFVLWRIRDVLNAHPAGAEGKTDFCLVRGAWSNHEAST